MIIHPSQAPDAVQRQLLDALRLGQVPPRFLYDGERQTQKWLAVHRAHSPSRTDAGVQSIYDQAFGSLGQAPGGLLQHWAVHIHPNQQTALFRQADRYIARSAA